MSGPAARLVDGGAYWEVCVAIGDGGAEPRDMFPEHRFAHAVKKVPLLLHLLAAAS